MPKVNVNLKPFTVPNFALMEKREGAALEMSFPLADLDATTLAEMCDDFRAEVFRKAGKPDPAAVLKVSGWVQETP